MGIISQNLDALLKQGLSSWVRDKTSLIFLVVTAIIIFVAGIISTFLLAGMVSASLTSLDITAIMTYIVLIWAISILEALILIAIEYVIIKRALELSGKKPLALSPFRYVMLIILYIASAIYAILSIYKIRMLIIGITGILVILLGVGLMAFGYMNVPIMLLGLVILFVGIILITIYLANVISNSIRLSLGIIAYIEKERKITDCLKASWDLTNKEVGGMILLWIIFALIVMFISIIASLPSTIIQLVSTIGSISNPLAAISFMYDPVYIIAMIPVYIVSAYFSVASGFLLAAMYTILQKNKKTK